LWPRAGSFGREFVDAIKVKKFVASNSSVSTGNVSRAKTRLTISRSMGAMASTGT
jgi:hypothetical protein